MHLRLSPLPLVCLLLCSACALAEPVTYVAKVDTTAKVSVAHARPVVFEMGKSGLPWRQVMDAAAQAGTVFWRARKGRTYEVWDSRDYALAQLNAVRRELGKPASTGAKLTSELASALNWLQKQPSSGDSERFRIAEARLSSGLSALLGIRIDIQAGVDQRVWPEFDLPLVTSFAAGSSGVRARFSSLTKPDNWSLAGRASQRWFTGSGKPVSSRMNIRVPGRAVFYPGDYPLIAWYDVTYGGARFRASNAAEASVIHAFEKTATVKTVSSTQIDLTVRLTSLLPIKGVTNELSLPDGWSGKVPQRTIDINRSRTITYRITRPTGEQPELNIVAAVYRKGDYATSKRLVVEHALGLGERTSVAGLKLVEIRGERSESATIADRLCRQIRADGHAYFDISENFAPGEERRTCGWTAQRHCLHRSGFATERPRGRPWSRRP